MQLRIDQAVLSILLVALANSAAFGRVDAESGEALSVRLHDGRQLEGELDARSDTKHLWLHTESPTIVIATSILWEDVAEVKQDGRTLTRAQVSLLVPSREVAGLDDFFTRARPPESVTTTGQRVQSGRILRHHAEENDFALHDDRRIRVQSLAVEIMLGNWDRDVEPDGYDLRIFPLGPNRQVLPVNGTLRVRLVVQDQTAAVHRPYADVFRDGERWSRRVRKSDFGRG